MIIFVLICGCVWNKFGHENILARREKGNHIDIHLTSQISTSIQGVKCL